MPQMGIFRVNPEGRGFPGGLLCRAACKGRRHLLRDASRMQRRSEAPRHVGSGGEHGSRIRRLLRCLRLASLRTFRGAALREPSRKAALRPCGAFSEVPSA
jgi:hypothetical protein